MVSTSAASTSSSLLVFVVDGFELGVGCCDLVSLVLWVLEPAVSLTVRVWYSVLGRDSAIVG